MIKFETRKIIINSSKGIMTYSKFPVVFNVKKLIIIENRYLSNVN